MLSFNDLGATWAHFSWEPPPETLLKGDVFCTADHFVYFTKQWSPREYSNLSPFFNVRLRGQWFGWITLIIRVNFHSWSSTHGLQSTTYVHKRRIVENFQITVIRSEHFDFNRKYWCYEYNQVDQHGVQRTGIISANPSHRFLLLLLFSSGKWIKEYLHDSFRFVSLCFEVFP